MTVQGAKLAKPSQDGHFPNDAGSNVALVWPCIDRQKVT